MSQYRAPLVQKMIDKVQAEGDRNEHIPKAWAEPGYGMEHALVRYIEDLERIIVEVKAENEKFSKSV